MAELSLDEKLSKIRSAVDRAVNPQLTGLTPTAPGEYLWVEYVYSDYAIISGGGKRYRVDYTTDGDAVTVTGELVEVKPEWKPVKGFLYAGNVDDDALKAGARNSRSDLGRLQMIHDYAVENGAACGRKAAAVPGNALKAIAKTDDELRVGNYIVLFGDPERRDLEGIGSPRKNKDGTIGEYFAPSVEVESEYTKSGALHVDWEHGLDIDAVGNHPDNVLGIVDWKTARRDERGIFVERVLNRRNKYVQWLEELIEAGMVGNSSQATDTGVEKTASGEIVRWPLMRDSLTVNPMEPRMLSVNQVEALKALRLYPTQEPQAAQAGEETPAPVPAVTQTKSVVGETTMTPEEIQAAIASAAEEGARKALASLPPTREPQVQVVGDESDRALKGNPFKSLGEMLLCVKNAAFGQRDARLNPLEAKAILGANETVASEGGFLVQTEQVQSVEKKTWDQAVFAGRTARRTIGAGANSVDFYGRQEDSRANGSRYGGVTGYRLAEGNTITASGTPKFYKYTLKPKKYAILAYATDEVLQDKRLLEDEIMEALPAELAFMLDDDILNGSGVGGPLGVMNHACRVDVAKESGQAADTIVAENIVKMWARRWARGSNYAWYVNQDVGPQLWLMNAAVGTGGQLVYMPPGGLTGSPYATLFGRPVIETEFNATLGDLGDILLADFSQYKLADKGAPQTAQSMHVQFLTDQMCYRFIARYDGQPTWKAPLTPYKGTANTQSPFVALAARA